MFSTRRLRSAPRRTVVLIALSFAVYLTAGICATFATAPVPGYTGISDAAEILLAATFGRSSTYLIVSAPLAWATRICWAASIALLILVFVVHVRYVRRLPPEQQAALAASYRTRGRRWTRNDPPSRR